MNISIGNEAEIISRLTEAHNQSIETVIIIHESAECSKKIICFNCFGVYVYEKYDCKVIAG